jgi:hypothetical protein
MLCLDLDSSYTRIYNGKSKIPSQISYSDIHLLQYHLITEVILKLITSGIKVNNQQWVTVNSFLNYLSVLN